MSALLPVTDVTGRFLALGGSRFQKPTRPGLTRPPEITANVGEQIYQAGVFDADPATSRGDRPHDRWEAHPCPSTV